MPIEGSRSDSAKDFYRSLGWTFDSSAEIYDNCRPRYANNAFNKLIEFTGLDYGARVLEIGCGAGQATLPMAERGYSLTAIEPGINLADLTRKKLRSYPNANVVTGKFESVDLPAVL